MKLNFFRASSAPSSPGVIGASAATVAVNIRIAVSDAGAVEAQLFHPHWDWFAFGREVVTALVHERTFLSYQLSYAKGLLGDEEFQEHVAHFLSAPRDLPNLENKALMLSELVPEHVDSELVASVFHCSLPAAERALSAAALQLRFSFATPVESLRQLITEQTRVDR